jgi:hypothetical protein
VKRLALVGALAVLGVAAGAGLAAASDPPPGHNGDPKYGHHRDGSGRDHYGKLYNKPVPAEPQPAPPDNSGFNDLTPGQLGHTFLG